MEEYEKKRPPATSEKNNPEQVSGEPSYPESIDPHRGSSEPSYPEPIEKMSEKWRSILRRGEGQDDRGFFERNSLALGLVIGLLIIALLIVIGGFAFLVWNAR